MSKAGKSVSIKVPTSKLASGADAWIVNRGAEPATDRESGNVTSLKSVEATPVETTKEKMSRFTIDVPESLHRRVKMQCAARGQKMADMMRDLLEREFPAS
jgi:predicted DNA binding CopG/RHH family protein